MERKKTYGRMITGELITDEVIERFVKKAEEGYDVEELLKASRSETKPSLPTSAHGRPAARRRPR